MNYSSGGFIPPENNSPQYDNGSQPAYNIQNGPKISHFVPMDIWAREKMNIRRLSTAAAVTIIAFIASSAVFVTVLQGLLSFVLEADSLSDLFGSSYFTYLFEILYSVFFVGGPFFILGSVMKKRGFLTEIPMGKPKNTKMMPLILVGGFGLCLAGNVITSYFDILFKTITGVELSMPEMPDTPHSFGGVMLFYISTAVIPAMIEEMALRGIVMQSLRRYGDWFAIICSAVIFGLMHCNLMQIPFALICGVIIGYAVISTGSLWTGIIIHFLNNAFTVTVQIINDFYGLESMAYSVINTLFYVFIVIGGICAFFYIRKYKTESFRKSPLVNTGRDFVGFVPQYSAKVSEGSMFKAYFMTFPMLIAFVAVAYQTIITMMVL